MITIISLIVLSSIGAVYFTWFYHVNCESIACLQAHQIKCSRASYIHDTESTTWEYAILGEKNGLCDIRATVLLVKSGQTDRKKMEQASMICSLPLGSKAYPESDILNCHGILKEEIQHIMIKNAHAQIVANIEQVGEDFAESESL